METLGNKELLKRPLVTVTGSRRANFEGRENARKFSQVLSSMGLGVVTGFADGIEEEIIRSVKDVITVMPCGILNPYPKTHAKLIKEVVKNSRMKIEEEPSNPAHLQTVWGFGYKWMA